MKKEPSPCLIYYTVNSGLCFSCGGAGVFIDGIHGGAATGYTPVSEMTVRECCERRGIFASLRALLFTHCHDDHYDAQAARRVSEAAGVPVFLPDGKNNEPVAAYSYACVFPERLSPFEIFAVRTVHDGREPLRCEPHFSFVINTPDETFFAAGDAVFEGPGMCASRILPLCRHRISAAFINPYQAILACNREFLKRLDPEFAVLIHRPLPRDDRYNAKLLFDTAVKKYPGDFPKLIRPEFYDPVSFP